MVEMYRCRSVEERARMFKTFAEADSHWLIQWPGSLQHEQRQLPRVSEVYIYVRKVMEAMHGHE